MPKVFAVDPRTGKEGDTLYHGEYHPTAQEALTRALAHLEANKTWDFR